ncbi:MAG: sigma-70 family RNA polymerase sigma factor [Pirellulales bacterium]
MPVLETANPMSSIPSLISGARQGDKSSLGVLLQQYRNYLTVLASTQLEHRLQPRVSPSDVVQETMLRAHKNFGQFRGTTEAELLAWLRQILVNNLAKFVEQHLLAARRDVRREVSIERLGAALEQSTVQLAALLPAAGNSPSMAVQQREEAVLLADRLAQLPIDYREVLVLRNLQGLPFEVVAQRMDRSVGATRMLWLRAIEKLRVVYGNEDQSGF